MIAALRAFARRIARVLQGDKREELPDEQAGDLQELPTSVHELCDMVGVPRSGAGMPAYSELARVQLLATRYAAHHRRIVAANTALLTTLRDARTLLTGSPNAGQLRVRRAIAIITDAITPKKP